METKIISLSWGEIEVRIGGQTRTFRDCKLWPGGAVSWSWEETDTHHVPGIQPADIHEILAKDIDVLLLSRGRLLRLQMAPETRQLLEERGIEFHFEETRTAADHFNRLVDEGRKVGGIFHTTC